MPAVPPPEANRARIMPRRVADADVLGDAGTVHAGTGGHARYVGIAMPPTNVSNVWPPHGTAPRNTWPADALGESSSRNPSRDILYAAGNPPRVIDFSATSNQTGTQSCWEPMAPLSSRLGVCLPYAPRRFFVSESGLPRKPPSFQSNSHPIRPPQPLRTESHSPPSTCGGQRRPAPPKWHAFSPPLTADSGKSTALKIGMLLPIASVVVS